jgi:hypothetical protein
MVGGNLDDAAESNSSDAGMHETNTMESVDISRALASEMLAQGWRDRPLLKNSHPKTSHFLPASAIT